MTIDEILKRMMLIYMPIFTLFFFISFSFIIPSTSETSNIDDAIVKFIIAEGEERSKEAHLARIVSREEGDQANDFLYDSNYNGGSNLALTAGTSNSGISSGSISSSSSSSNDIDSSIRSSNNSRGGFQLDFLIAGFAKSGSTSLLHLFDKHDETSVARMEICAFNSDMAIAKLSTILDELPQKSSSMQRGIKCPTSTWDAKGLSKLATIKQDLKIIVGVRHPAVSWFQSYYNYRVTEMHDKNVVIQPPSAESLIGSKSWMGVSTDGARFELGLMQLGKIEIDYKDLLVLGGSGRRVFPSSFKVFLYSIDQLEDTNDERSKIFRHDLQTFLGLEDEIEEIPRSNVNHFTGKSRHPETINICDSKYKRLRSVLLKNANRSNKWIRSKFIHHMDVTVGGRSHFLRIIDGWQSDPCLSD